MFASLAHQIDHVASHARFASRDRPSRHGSLTPAKRFFAATVFGVSVTTGTCASDASFRVRNVEAHAPGMVSILIDVTNWADTKEAPQFSLTIEQAKVPSSDVKRVGEGPLAVVICIDRSGSMRKPGLEGIRRGLGAFLQVPHPGVDLALIAFGSGTKTLAGFGSDSAKRRSSAEQIQLEGRDSKTALYEAVQAAVFQLATRPVGTDRRVIVISDGQDDGSDIQLDKVVSDAVRASIAIDVISTGPSAAQGLASLQDLSGRTRGALVSVPTGSSVGPALEELVKRARAMGGSYQATFTYMAANSDAAVESATVSLVTGEMEASSQAVGGQFARIFSAPLHSEQRTGSSGECTLTDFACWFHRHPVMILSVAATGALLLLGIALRKRSPGPITVAGLPVGPLIPPVPHSPPRERLTTIARDTFAAPAHGRPTVLLAGRGGPIGAVVTPVEQPLFRIGAGENSDLRLLQDDFVSHEHASIRHDSGGLYLDDRGSRNGTYLNGTRLAATPVPLAFGDRIRIGRSELSVERPGGAPRSQRGRIDEGSIS